MSIRSEFGDGFDGLLTAAQAGAGWAMERLWTALAPRVVGYLRMQGAQEPEDLTSEVFLSAFRGLGSFSGDEAGFRSWLFTIAHRRLLDERRRTARAPEVEALADTLENAGPSAPEADVLRRLASERVRTVCERLVPDQRDVLLLRLVGGFTVEEVAGMLDKSTGAVKALQRRGLAALRRIFEREGVPL